MALTVEVAVFVNTNLGTRMAMDVSPDITARDLKRELETQHFNCFWNSGEIRVSRLMVKRKSCLYHLPDSVPMKSVFRGVKGTWFLHVEARFLSDCNRPCLPKYAASKPKFSITHPLHPENIVTSTAKSNTKGHCKRMLREKLFRCHNPLLGKLRRPFFFTKIRKRRKKISSAYEVNRVQIDKEKFPDCASKSMIDEPTHTSSEVVSVSGIIHRYFSNLSEDGGPSSPTRSVTSRVVQSWPEEHLKTKADDICSSIQVSPLTQFSAKRTAKPVCLPSPTGYGQRRYKLNKPEVGKRLVVASYSLGISPSKEHPAISLQLRRLDSFTQSSKNTTFFPLPLTSCSLIVSPLVPPPVKKREETMELINSRVFLLVLLISISSGQVSSRPTPQADAAVENICAKTTNSALCSSTVLPNLRGNADPTTVLQIEMKACLDLTKGALGQLKKTASNPSTSPADVSSIKVCQEVYEYAVDDINGASEAIAARDVGTVQTRLSAVITYFGTCDDAVAESPGFKLPLKADDVVTLNKLASNCMAISTLLK